jgi:hypothetical protein
MRTKAKILASTSLLLFTFTFGHVVVAQSGDESVSSDQTTQTDGTTETNAQKQQSLLDRIEKRKDARKLRLSFAEKAKLTSKCKAAQGLLRAAEVRIKGVETSRAQVHENLLARLNGLVTKLKEKQIDTGELETQITELTTKIEAFKTKITDYKQAVSDLGAMDCTTDPEGFKASLEDARALRVELKDAAADVRTYLRETIKETLKGIRQQVVDGAEGGDE